MPSRHTHKAVIPTLFLDDIPRKPRNGYSISIQGKTDDAGTLGGWLTLNRPQQKQSFKCALTCYHVVKDAKRASQSIPMTMVSTLRIPEGMLLLNIRRPTMGITQ
jgi:hypothetical protein